MDWKLIAGTILSVVVSSAASAQLNLVDKDKTKLDLNVEVVGATFGFTGSYFGNSEEFNGANTDTWSEGALEIGLALETKAGEGAFFAELSGLYTRTWGDDASGLTVGLDRTEEFSLEQTHVGWRSGGTFASLDEDALTLKAGSFDYRVGTGLLIADGASDGGERGGWFLSARKAFRNGFLVTFDTGPWKAEGFYLENETRFEGIQGYGWGFNLEYEIAAAGLDLGLLWVESEDVPEKGKIGTTATGLRADWAATDGLSFSGEVVLQDKDGAEPKGFFVNGSYGWHDKGWKPKVSYRYASFSGDDLSTPGDEGWSSFAYGFTDYGYWFQGEITGNYPLGNDNLKSHMIRLELSPNEDLTLNVIYYDFTLNQPHIFGDPVSSLDWGDEIDLAADWVVGDHLFVNGVFGVLFPGQAAIDWTGGDEDWIYGMLLIGYAF